MISNSIFITGATGLVGSHLVRLLVAKGYHRIKALKRKGSDMALLGDTADKVEWIEGDLLDVECLNDCTREVDWVFHAAGLISYDPVDEHRLHLTNVEGTANVVNASLHAGVRKLLHVSSISVLARTGRRERMNESTTWKSTRYTSNYGLTKHLAETEVHRGIAEGLDASIIIPSIILGAGDWHDGSASVFRQIDKGMPAYPVGSNGYVDVRDVALLSLRIMEEPGMHRVIANGSSVNYKELFTAIAQRIGQRPPAVRVGPIGSEVLWRLFLPYRWFTGRLPVINKEMTRAAQCFSEYDNSRSLSFPGFRYTPLTQTLDDIAREFLKAREKKFAPGFLPFSDEYLS